MANVSKSGEEVPLFEWKYRERPRCEFIAVAIVAIILTTIAALVLIGCYRGGALSSFGLKITAAGGFAMLATSLLILALGYYRLSRENPDRAAISEQQPVEAEEDVEMGIKNVSAELEYLHSKYNLTQREWTKEDLDRRQALETEKRRLQKVKDRQKPKTKRP